MRSRRSSKNPSWLWWLASITLSVAAHTASAAVVTLAPNRDNTLYESSSGAVSNGAGTATFAGRNSQAVDSVRRVVMAFDIASQIPAGSMVNSVNLTLHNGAANTGEATLELHRLLADWGEGDSIAGGGQGSGAPAAPGDATWLHTFYPSATWSQTGGDFGAAVSGALVVSGPGAYAWPSTPQSVADVQAFLDHPASNFGWLIVGDESAPSTAKRFSTREEADPALRPLLVVDYSLVPEPGTLSALLVLIVAATCRRRRTLTSDSHTRAFKA